MLTSSDTNRRDPDTFPDLARSVRRSFSQNYEKVLFRTTTPDLFAVYLAAFPKEEHQSHNCHACRHFIQRYGGLVTIDETGETKSVLWSNVSEAPAVYRASIRALRDAVEKAPVEGTFLSSENTWGTGRTPVYGTSTVWNHFEVENPAPFKNPLRSADQVMAERREEFLMLNRGINEFSPSVVRQAVALLETESLYRGEKTLGVAQWLLGLHEQLAANRSANRKRNVIWRAAATAPAGWCHVKASMIGTLLEDIESGMDLAAVKRRFDEKMDPLKYQRAQVAPKAGNVAQAEKLVEQLETAGALSRRFARLEDLQTEWQPRPQRARDHAPRNSVFAGLTASRQKDPQDIPGTTRITWEKFARTVLPMAGRIEFQVPMRGAFLALVTAANPDAPPILQWDHPERRNPVSWYLYAIHGGSLAANWNLAPGWRAVTAVTMLPPMWAERPLASHGEGVVLVLEGARDLRHVSGGGYFTESLRAEYHAVRATLEAHMKRSTIAGKAEATACGYDLRKGATWNAVVRVTTDGTRRQYMLDRWD